MTDVSRRRAGQSVASDTRSGFGSVGDFWSPAHG